MMNYVANKTQNTTSEPIKMLKQFIVDHDYDSDALIQDLEEEYASNIYNICTNKEYILHCKDFVQYFKCLCVYFVPFKIILALSINDI